MRQYIPNDKLDASNSRLIGLSTDRHGRITELRVKFTQPTEEQANVLFKDKGVLNPIDIPTLRP